MKVFVHKEERYGKMLPCVHVSSDDDKLIASVEVTEYAASILGAIYAMAVSNGDKNAEATFVPVINYLSRLHEAMRQAGDGSTNPS